VELEHDLEVCERVGVELGVVDLDDFLFYRVDPIVVVEFSANRNDVAGELSVVGEVVCDSLEY
jgi:hypothetical protein